MKPAADALIAPARPQDLPDLLRLIKGLAEYENLSHLVCATEADLEEALFGPRPVVEALMAHQDGRAVGFALYFYNYSTFLGRRGIYLEDIFVEPSHRGHGTGKALLRRIAAIAVERGCGRFEWSVLDWNTPSIRFYEMMGATVLPEWRIVRTTGAALESMAGLLQPANA